MTIKIVSNEKGNPPGKLADAELHFTDGPLEGLKLIGFSRLGAQDRRRAERHVPGAHLLGQRRAALVRAAAAGVDSTAQNRIRDLILEAYAEHAGGRDRGDGVGRSRLGQHRQELLVLGGALRRQRPLLAQALVELGAEEGRPSCRRR